MGTEAELTRLTINNASAAAPGPISPAEFDDLDYDLSGEDYRIINLLQDEDLVGVYLKPTASRGARVAWGIGDLIERPMEFFDYRVPAYFNNEDYIYIRVISEDTLITNYYRFHAFLLKKGTSLADVFVDGKRAVLGGAAGTWNVAEQGTLDITIPGSTNARINAIPFESSSTLRYARVRSNNATPSFSTNAIMTFTDQDILYIEVTAENTVDKAFYKLLVGVGRITNIEKLTFIGMGNNPSTVTEITNKGTSHTDWGEVSMGYYESADMPAGGWGINIELEDPGSRYEFLLVSKNASSPPAFNGIPETASFDNTNLLAIKVTPQSGIAAAIKYYKVDVKLLAANFKEHPKSAIYYYYKDPATVQEILRVDFRYGPDPLNSAKEILLPEEEWTFETLPAGKGKKIEVASPTVFTSDPVVPLSFELDRIGSYTYQWWESNSWYGGYGFDEDGKMCYNIVDSAGNTQFNWEEGFTSDPYHHRQFDEKANPSLFNGGNQAAVYELPGRPIEGATSATYTPDTSKRPFLAGFSYEAHYYWVVVKDSRGYETTSGRATIISERDKSRKYLMLDVNNSYKVGDTPLRFRNNEVFTQKYDKWRIPLEGVIPDNFNITDWKILTAQAKFYLTDGKEWIQNWTNGNLSFEDNSNLPDWYPLSEYQHGPVPSEADVERYGVEVLKKDAGCGAGYGGQLLGLFYNLTNNNATYDVTSDVKEDGDGASLKTGKFTHIVIEPSGDHTKGSNYGYPPLGSDGKAGPSIVGEDLQGWFCGFVELVELHFVGPR
jgi:hypothetical protein